ncbi:MAG: hypothetical protein ACK4ND_08290 [Cytophagaceae bacterium]
MENNTDEWIDKTMNSLEGIERAEPSPFLFRKIMNAVEERKTAYRPVHTRAIWQTAVAFIVLLLLNFYGIFGATFSGNEITPMETIAEDYELVETDTYYTYFE